MLRSLKELFGYELQALDGDIGVVEDFYFDDFRWTTRYLVAKTRKWLPGRQVLISPGALEKPDWQSKKMPVQLTKKQIENSPSIETNRPVSRQEEEEIHAYYNWPPYWTEDDYNLQSAKDVLGYVIAARDADIGQAEDFVIDDVDWRVRYLVVDTKKLIGGKKVILALDWIDEIVTERKNIRVDITKSQVENAPEYKPDALINREYEVVLYDFYGRPRYWE